MKLQRNELKKELIKSGLNSSIIIRSPSDGIIDTLNVSQGQIVNAGDTLSQIIPEEDRKLYLILWIPDMAIPYIKKVTVSKSAMTLLHMKSLDNLMASFSQYLSLLLRNKKC